MSYKSGYALWRGVSKSLENVCKASAQETLWPTIKRKKNATPVTAIGPASCSHVETDTRSYQNAMNTSEVKRQNIGGF